MNHKILIVNEMIRNDRPSYMNEIPIIASFGDRPYIKASENDKYSAYITSYIESPNRILELREEIADAKLDNPKVLALVDPVFGDNGVKYNNITTEHIDNYRKLIEVSDILTPNLTEACILSGESYESYKEKYCTIKYENDNKDKVDSLSKKIIESIFPLLEKIRFKKNQISIITGIELYNAVLTILDVYDGDHGKRQTTCNYSEKIEDRDGPGDIFDAMFFEAATNGFNLVDALSVSTSFINNSLRYSRDRKIPFRDGIVFEPILHDNIAVIKQRLTDNNKENNSDSIKKEN